MAATAAAGFLLGNLSVLVDAGWPPERSKTSRLLPDLAAARPRWDSHPSSLVIIVSSSCESVGPRRRGRVAAFSSEGGGGGGGGRDGDEWEQELRNRLKELEEMKELERRAEELQNRVADEELRVGETEEEKRERVRRELEKVAKEQAERRRTAKLMFEVGQKAYEKGMYGRAIEFLEAALTIIARPTLLGGEIQIWLAMAYEANGRHRDCIALYEQLEKKHPIPSIRRQAAELRYILQAPKLKISKDEMVTIPLIGSSYDWYAGTWSDKYKDQDRRKKATTSNQLPSSSRASLGGFLMWRPRIGLDKSSTLWIVFSLWLGLVITALIVQT